jgi:hypothetical protein
MRESLFMLVAASALTTLSAGCHHRAPEGPAEKAGRAVDDAARKTTDATKDAAHDTKKDLDSH